MSLDRSQESPKSDAISDKQYSDLSGAMSHLSLAEDEPDLTSVRLDSRSGDTMHACRGALVHWTPGDIWLTYSFAMHSHDRNPLPWELANIVDGTTLYIRSQKCTGFLSGLEEIESGCCATCSSVPNEHRFCQFMDLANEQFAVIKRKVQKQKQLRMKIVRLLMLISTCNIPALRRLIAATLKRGCSPVAIVTRLEQAVRGKGLPRSGFDQQDFDKAFLVKALGGPSLLRALHRAEGYAALILRAKRSGRI
ncbi:hypothetical protein F5878DRAFT_668260 [Lentinula raphanica]|uniref:Uncharacterized protein n=1 Tax=Lentinula raphanica TaxID=153919 RepID=A0AA38NUN3_9AGAR|nr:hypothetical protein F5878DRAFT_668260 [Lentinula raphanica]